MDYLEYLGVDYLWLTPVYQSPMNDNGYDISDYLSINEDFGTKEDLRHLLDEAHKHHLKVMLDIVINHTSTEHEWFREAISAPDNPYRDYYFFRKSAKEVRRQQIGNLSSVEMLGNMTKPLMNTICISSM